MDSLLHTHISQPQKFRKKKIILHNRRRTERNPLRCDIFVITITVNNFIILFIIVTNSICDINIISFIFSSFTYNYCLLVPFYTIIICCVLLLWPSWPVVTRILRLALCHSQFMSGFNKPI